MSDMTDQELAALELPLDLFHQWQEMREYAFSLLGGTPEIRALEESDMDDYEFSTALTKLVDAKARELMGLN